MKSLKTRAVILLRDSLRAEYYCKAYDYDSIDVKTDNMA